MDIKRTTRFSTPPKKSKSPPSKPVVQQKKRKSYYQIFGVGEYRVRKSLYEYEVDILRKHGRFLQNHRIFIFAKNDMSFLPKEDKDEEKYVLYSKLRKIFEDVEEQSLTDDTLGGLFLFMESYTLLVLEGTEFMVSQVCTHLIEETTEIWLASKIFMIEDRIGARYFNKFYLRYIKPMNVNEKFAPNTANDVDLMGKEHWNLKVKIQELCAELSEDIKEMEGRFRDAKNKSTTSIFTKQSILSRSSGLTNVLEMSLAPEEYSKMVPEIQRIDLVLSSDRFYRNLVQHTELYFLLPKDPDNEDDAWRIPTDYMLYDLFDPFTVFDVNRTFGDYIRQKRNATLEVSGSHEGEKGEAEEEEGEEKSKEQSKAEGEGDGEGDGKGNEGGEGTAEKPAE